jgi:hypothetical protein
LRTARTPRGLPAFAATILLTVVPGPDLYRIDVKSLQECTRKRLLRAGFEGAVGGFEAAFHSQEDLWIVHIHLLLLGEIQEAKPRLRNAFPDIGLGRPVVCRALDSRITQITYVQKFHAYHRPGSGKGAFENLHGYRDHHALAGEMINLVRNFHGVAADEFIRKLTTWRSRDNEELGAFLDDRVESHRRAAAERISSPGRDLGRFHNKFATILGQLLWQSALEFFHGLSKS